VPTPESKPPELSSIYALGKFEQERSALLFGRAYDIPTAALRFFNVYGPHQALSNPYTGVLAIFASRLLNGKPPMIFEDGEQRRDFVSVHDIARACVLALEQPGIHSEVINIGSGSSVSVNEIARRLANTLGKESITPEITGEYRVGDIRHCFADIHRAREVLRFEPAVSLDEGIEELARWLEGQVADDRVDDARRELTMRGLTVGAGSSTRSDMRRFPSARRLLTGRSRARAGLSWAWSSTSILVTKLPSNVPWRHWPSFPLPSSARRFRGAIGCVPAARSGTAGCFRS
jgi:dTDP-L-rhamnose 4-epimerase